jgi:hypothetical protein
LVKIKIFPLHTNYFINQFGTTDLQQLQPHKFTPKQLKQLLQPVPPPEQPAIPQNLQNLFTR